jgi:hypothetical protein
MGMLVFLWNRGYVTGEPREWRQKYEGYGKALILKETLIFVISGFEQ